MCPQSKAQHGESRDFNLAFSVRRRLDLRPKELAQVLGCTERTIRRWEKGIHRGGRKVRLKPEAMYEQIFNWVDLRLNEVNKEEAKAWGDRVRDAVALESPTAGLRELLTSPSRTETIVDFDRHAQRLERYGARRSASDLREQVRPHVRDFRASCDNYIDALDEERKRLTNGLLDTLKVRESLENPANRALLMESMRLPGSLDRMKAALQQITAALPQTDPPTILRAHLQDPAAAASWAEEFWLSLETLVNKAPKRRGKRQN